MRYIHFVFICSVVVSSLQAIELASLGMIGGINQSKYRWVESANSYQDLIREPSTEYQSSWQMGVFAEKRLNTLVSARIEVLYQNIHLQYGGLDWQEASADGPSYGSMQSEFLSFNALLKLTPHRFSPHVILGVDNLYYLAYEAKSCRGGTCATTSNKFNNIHRYLPGASFGVGKDCRLGHFILSPELRYYWAFRTIDNYKSKSYENWTKFNSFQILVSIGTELKD